MLKDVFTAQFPIELNRLIRVIEEWMSDAAQPEPELPVADESKRLATSVRR
jgi:hypothetical protein